MGQVKIYGLKSHLSPKRSAFSRVIHSCMVDALAYPADKKFHRFFPMEKEDFYFPEGRTDAYTIIEISMFEGRTQDAKKKLIRFLFERIGDDLEVSSEDIEITITETPKHNWGIRGLPGDELALNYKVDV